jgi:hypothetical protein
MILPGIPESDDPGLLPKHLTSPSSILTREQIALKIVVLPHPDGPSKPYLKIL